MPDATLDLDALWGQAVAQLQRELPGPSSRTWLEETRAVGFSDDTVVLAAPHSFAREQLDVRHGPALRGALTKAAGRALTVVVTIAPTNGRPAVSPTPDPWPVTERGPSAPKRSQVAPESVPRQARGLDNALNPAYTLERFVVGASNRLAQAGAYAVSVKPAKAYNPLFIYGCAGLGKTHLLQAIGHYTLHRHPDCRVRYVTSEQFTNEFIHAISNKRIHPFHGRYRDVDVLLIDDIQFLANKDQTKEEFFHTFNHLYNAEKQIVITSDRPPRQLGQLEDRLLSRFASGLACDVQPPDLETRMAILRRKSEQDGIVVPLDVLELIADRIASNIRELQGAFVRVAAFASLQGTEVTMNLANMVLKDLFPEAGSSQVTVSLIMSETANYLGFTLDELCSASRTRSLVNARQIAMFLTRDLTDLSLPKIGEAFGGRDHTTVLHAVKKITALIGGRAGIYDQVQELTSRIKVAALGSR